MLYEAFAGITPTGTTAFAFQNHVPGAQFVHALKVDSEEANAAQMQFIWQKFFCHALISKLPDAAMSEVEERLVEIFEDYSRRQAVPGLSDNSAPRVFMAQQGRRYPRPEIELED
jgi:hypothetical protein